MNISTSAGKSLTGKSISVAAVDDPSYSPSLTQSFSLPSASVPCKHCRQE